MRWGYVLVNITGIARFLRSAFFNTLLLRYNHSLIYTLTAIVYCFSFYLMISTIASIRLGERFIYYTRAEGGRGQLRLLFRFMGPKKSFRSLKLYSTLLILKSMWLLYLMLPPVICGACILYLYVFGKLSPAVLVILLTGEALLFAISIVMWRVCSIRYDGAVYYFCLGDISVRKAIKKSIRHTDGTLSDGVVLEYSLLGWILSCILIIPIIYCVPYIKLCRATFVTEAVSRRVASKSKFAISFMSCKHINEGG
jgi:hypothetical protein